MNEEKKTCSCGHDHSHEHEHTCSCGHDHGHEHHHHHEHGESCSCGHDHSHEHEHTCSCGHDHSHEHHHHDHGESCSCGHDHGHEHHHHEHGESCSCGHDHGHEHHHEHGESCSCGHDHSHEHEHTCSCGHDHGHEHHHEGCSCGHDHGHEHHHEGCSCGHDHSHEHHHEGCSCGHDHSHSHSKFALSKDKAAFTASSAGACTCGHDHGHSHSHDHHHHDHGCSCGHDHEHGDGCGCGHDHGVVREDSKSFVIRLLIAFGIVVAANLVPIKLVSIALFLVAYVLAGYEVLGAMFRGIRKGNFMDENFLMGIASVGAFAIGEYTEAVAVLIFYGIGELCQNIAIARSRGNIASLMDIRPDYANLLKNGETITVSPESVHIGSIILVKPGEKIPLDGIIRKGSSSLDTSALTGESLPRDVAEGDKVLSGSINKSGLLEVETTSTFGDSTVSKILEMVEHASSNKAESEKFITKFAKIYTPAVVYSAIAVAVIPPIIFGFDTFTTWFYRALNFLIISCPCALVISIPMSFFGGIGGAARNGVLVKGGNYLEALNNVTTFVFDKTGTLTEGKFSVSAVNPNGVSEDEVVKNAAICEKHSNHPIAVSIREYYGDKEIEDYAIEEIAGQGIKATKGEDVLLSGNIKLMESFGIKADEVKDGTTVVYVAKNGKFIGSVSISDNLKKETKEALKELKAEGVHNLVMLTGDREEVAEIIAKEIGITDYKAELMPQDKVTAVEEILKNSKGKTVFVGDGINDAPVLARADIGMAMGGIGSDAAIEAADIVIMNDDLKKLPLALRCAKKTRSVVMQNIVFALGTKALILILSVFGITSIWFAIFADVGVALIAILNATRALKVK